MCAGVTIAGADQSGEVGGGGRAVDPGRWTELAHGVTILLTQVVPHGVTILLTQAVPHGVTILLTQAVPHGVTILLTGCTTWCDHTAHRLYHMV